MIVNVDKSRREDFAAKLSAELTANSQQGQLRVHGPVSELLSGIKGPAELRFVIGRADALGEGNAPKQKALSVEKSGPGWQTLRYAVELVDAP